MISKCSRLLLATQRNALSLVCRHASNVPTGMDIRFDDKKVLITGAGKGIGRTLALKLADAGANVVAISRTQLDLESLKSENPNFIQTLCLDISKWYDTKFAIKDLGPVDLLVNNAGITDAKELGRITKDEVKRVFNNNVKPIINITQLIANEMKVRGQGGSIVNISSVIGERAAPYASVYGASKAAVNQLTRSMAVEYGPHQIRVNSVNPTVVRTENAERSGMFNKSNKWANDLRLRTPLQRFAESEDIVGPVFFLLSEHSAMVTGVSLFVDGGLSVCFL